MMSTYLPIYVLVSFWTYMLHKCECPGLAANFMVSTLRSRMGLNMVVQGRRDACVSDVDR